MLLCFFPFLIVLNALSGRSTVDTLVRHLGLSQQAASYVSQLFAPGTATSNAVSGLSGAFFVLGGIAASAGIQDLYENVFELDRGGMKDIGRRAVWLATLIGVSVAAAWAGPRLRSSAGPFVLGVVAFAVSRSTGWFTMWFLLAGRVPWRKLVPSAIATGLFWDRYGSGLFDHLRTR